MGHAPNCENRSQFAYCLMKPLVPTVSQPLIIGQDMTEFMGELVCELTPVSTSCWKEDCERFFKRRTKESYRIIVQVGRGPYHNASRWKFPEYSCEMAGDVR